MSRDSYSRGRGGAALLLLIAAVALVVAVLAIFTSVFEKDKAKPDDAPGTDVIQPAEPDDTGSDTPDVPADPDTIRMGRLSSWPRARRMQSTSWRITSNATRRT